METIAVASGRNGVGKSMFCANLALALGQNGRRVIAVDLNIGGSGLHEFLAPVNFKAGIATYCEKPYSDLADILYPTEYENLSLIPCEPDAVDTVILPFAARLMSNLQELDCDYLLLNLGSGFHRSAVDLFLRCSTGILVTDPSVDSSLKSYLFIKNSIFYLMSAQFPPKSKAYHYLGKLGQDGTALEKVYLLKLLEHIQSIDPKSYRLLEEWLKALRPKLVLNMIKDPKDTQQVTKLRHSSSQYLGVDLEHLGVIYFDETQDQALTANLPVLAYKPQAILSQAIYRIAGRILEEEGAGSRPPLESSLSDPFAVFADNSPSQKVTEHTHLREASGVTESQSIAAVYRQTEAGMKKIIKSQEFDIQQLKLENQFLKKKILESAKARKD